MHRRDLAASTVLALALSATALASADAAHASTTAHAASHAHAKAGAYTVTAKVNRIEPEVGDPVKIRGSVSPAAPGAEVLLQVRYADQKSWKTVDRSKLSGAGRFQFKDKPSTVRERKYRVVKPAGNGRAEGRATTQKVTVYGWRTLDSLDPVAASGVYEAGNATLNGTTYPSSLRSTTAGGHVDYNLNRDCRSLDAVYGLDDASPIGGSATISVVADGATRHSGSYALTQAQRVVTDVTGVFRLTVNATSSGGGIAGVGTPKVLCSF